MHKSFMPELPIVNKIKFLLARARRLRQSIRYTVSTVKER